MSMRRIVVRSVVFTAALCSAVLFAQPKPAVPSASGVPEFPVTMRQNVVAGTTPVGTKVEAKLIIATLANGTVIPMGATFSGEVVESTAKSATVPSRLAIRMDSVRWKKGSVPIKVYLTAWYYPIRIAAGGDLSNEPPTGIHGDIGMQKGASRQSGPPSQPFPTGSTADGPDGPLASAPSLSDHRAPMKDVESTRQSDGAVAITSSRFNIKLDKSTTYILATDNLAK